MSYARVIPRDLFNEADLLKCLGRLAIILDDHPAYKAALDHDDEADPGFAIEQDECDGSISVVNVMLAVAGDLFPLHRPLNSRKAWPLYVRARGLPEDFEIRVFDEDGNLSAEMKELLEP